jgi:hypothetical protein
MTGNISCYADGIYRYVVGRGVPKGIPPVEKHIGNNFSCFKRENVLLYKLEIFDLGVFTL